MGPPLLLREAYTLPYLNIKKTNVGVFFEKL